MRPTNSRAVRSARRSALVAFVVACVVSCATRSTTAPQAAQPSTSSSLPPLPPGDSAALAPADSGPAPSASDVPNVAIDSDLPEPGDAHTEGARACTWPLLSRTLIHCASLFDTEKRTDVAPHEKARLYGVLVVRRKTGALTEFETPSMRVLLDAWPDCEGDAPVAIEGNLEPTGAPTWGPLMMAGGEQTSPYKLEHAKVLGPASLVCKATPGLPTANPFDRRAVAQALGAVNLDTCRTYSDAGSETGHVKITFNPKGTVARVELDSPLPRGESVARCVRDHFSRVRIPPFDGGEITVGKSFVLP